MTIRQSKHLPSLAEGEESVTGSLDIRAGQCGFSQFARVVPVIESNSAPNTGYVVTVSYSKNKEVATIKVWKATSSSDTTLIAATDAVTVAFLAMGA